MKSRKQTSPSPPGNALRHLAIVIDGLAGGGERAEAVAAAFGKAREVAEHAYAVHSALVALSFFSPQVQCTLFDPRHGAAARKACTGGLQLLKAAAQGCGAGFRVIGARAGLPPELSVPDDRAGEGERIIAWFLNYSGRGEILRAAERYLESQPRAPLAAEEFPSWLDTAGMPDPDLILYAGGELEPKDFLLWQASYAEIWHSPRPWTLFSPGDLEAAIEDYFARQRRFGR